MIQSISWHHANQQDHLHQELEPEQALRSLAQCELAFDALITCIEPTRVALETNVLLSGETTIYTGEAHEMSALVDLTCWYVSVSGSGTAQLKQLSSHLPPQGERWPELISGSPPEDRKATVVKLAILAWLDLEPSKELVGMSLGYLIDAAAMHHQRRVPLVELCLPAG